MLTDPIENNSRWCTKLVKKANILNLHYNNKKSLSETKYYKKYKNHTKGIKIKTTLQSSKNIFNSLRSPGDIARS